MSDVLHPQLISVCHDNTLVVVKIGSTEMRLDHEAALNLSHWLRVHGLAAKRNAGDHSHIMRVSGLLTDAEEDDKKHQKRQF